MGTFEIVRATPAGKPIEVYGEGKTQRDVTSIDDRVVGVVRLIGAAPVEGASVGTIDPHSPAAPWQVLTIGGGPPVGLMPFESIERAFGIEANKVMLTMQEGDAVATFSKAELMEASPACARRRPSRRACAGSSTGTVPITACERGRPPGSRPCPGQGVIGRETDPETRPDRPVRRRAAGGAAATSPRS